MRKILITGGAGFIGSHAVKFALQKNFAVVNFDKLNYAANLENLKSIEKNPNYKFVRGDICDADFLREIFEKEKFDFVLNFAAETHVDFSIENPAVFAESNFIGAQNIFTAARDFKIQKIVQISTDEVYGALKIADEKFSENSPLAPNSPYAASKAAADLLARSFWKTFDLPICVSRCSNNFGPHQDFSKLIPKIISRGIRGEKIPIYGRGENIREWIFVENHVRGIFEILERGKVGEIYNLGSRDEFSNLEIARRILKILNRPENLIEFVADRPGHDFRYALNCDKIERELDFKIAQNFDENLQKTVEFFTEKIWI